MIAHAPIPVSACPQSNNLFHVLTVTPFYPSAGNEAGGCFVAEPLEWTGSLKIKNTVYAVQPFYRGRVNRGDSAPPAHWVRFPSLPSGLGLPSSGAFLFARLLRKVRKLHRTNPIDMIHAHGALPCGHAAALLGRELDVPFVVTVHGLDVFSTNQVRSLAGNWAERVSRLVYQMARSIICVSQKVRDQLNDGMPDLANATVIHNGVDSELFCPADSAEPCNTILSVGNLIPTKGHALLVRAFSQISERFPHLVLKIVGEGQELPRLRKLVRNLTIAQKVQFLGRQNRRDVAYAMQSCALFALPSSYEGLGCAYLEAMSAGKAVIGCSGQGIEDVVEHGVNGWLIQPDNLEEMITALSLLLSNMQLRCKLGRAARETIVHNFTFEHQADQLNRVYREFAG
jgi:teichuronic acid biosynthesis glycosyltransferase TuaC